TAGRRICLWSVHDQNLIKEFTASSPRAHIANGEHEVAFSPDGKLLASGGGDPFVRLWDIATGSRIEEPVPSNVGASFFSFIGSDTLAWVDRTLVLLDLTTRQRRPEHLPDEATTFRALAWNPVAGMFALAENGGPIQLLDAATLKKIAEPLVGHRDAATY